MVTAIKKGTSIVHVTEPFVILDVDLNPSTLEKRTGKLGENMVKTIRNLDAFGMGTKGELVKKFVQYHLSVIESLLKENDPFKFSMIADTFSIADSHESKMMAVLRTYTYVNSLVISTNDMEKLEDCIYDLLSTIRKISVKKNNYNGRNTPVAIPFGLFCRKYDGVRKFSWNEVLDVFDTFSDYFHIDIVVYDHRKG